MGDTHVLCAATIEDRIPPHLRGKGTGWVTAEYSMLPGATSERSQRETVKGRQGGRTHEIQRLIGRSLRGVVDTTVLGERTVTRRLRRAPGRRRHALRLDHRRLGGARHRARRRGLERALRGHLAAVSVGIVDETLLLDLDYSEDSHAEVDFNVVGHRRRHVRRGPGHGRGQALHRQAQMDGLLALADGGLQQLFAVQQEAVERSGPPAASPPKR